MATDGRFDESLVPAAGALLVAGLAAVAHAEILGFWFTGTDTIPLIESSRIGSVEAAASRLSEPLMAGTTFAENARFYRPVVTLTFALDYAVWGLDPVGYHLTDLVLHAGTAALVCLLVRELGDGDDLAGVLAGIVFGLHPLTIEVVPSPARRQDVLATAFVVLSVLLFVRGLRRERPWLVVAAAGAFLLALGSKETAVVLPVLVAAWFVAREAQRGPGPAEFVRRSVAYGAPFAVATAGYFAVRLHVLGGLGGYVGRDGGAPVATLATRYARGLLYPVDHLYLRFGIGAPVVPDGLLVLAGIGGLLALLAVVRDGSEIVSSDRALQLFFLVVWGVVPFALIAHTGRFALRSGYVSLVPVAAVVGFLLAPALRRLADRGRDGLGATPDLGAALLAVLLATSLVAGSPLVRSCDGWAHAGDVTRQAIDGVERHDDAFADGDEVTVAGIPSPRSVPQVTEPPRARSVTYFWPHTLQAWFRLQDPGRTISFSVNDTVVVTHRRVDVGVKHRSGSSGHVVELTYDPRPGGDASLERAGGVYSDRSRGDVTARSHRDQNPPTRRTTWAREAALR